MLRLMKSPTRTLVLFLLCIAAHCSLRLCLAQQTAPELTTKLGANVLVVYYSMSGNTEKMAESVVEGAKRVEGSVVQLRPVSNVTKDDLQNADGIVLGCPTYFANIPGPMKVAMDDWNWKWHVDFTDKIGGAFSTGGGQTGGKEHVVESLLLFMLSNRMIVAGPLYRNETTGSVWGEPGSSAMTGPLDPGVREEELDAARRLGERIAQLALKLK